MTDLFDSLRSPSGACLGAAFISYDFDESFFETLLASLLTIHADPDTDPHRFADEGRRRLRETPVMVLVDGFRERGGHRLPFDLIVAPPRIALHPKVSLALYADHARVLIGSANLNEGGYSANAELVGHLVLDYGERALQEVRALFRMCGATGEAWETIEAQLDLLCSRRKTKASPARVLFGKDVLGELFALLPKRAKITSVTLILGSQPEDDAGSETTLLARLADHVGHAPIRLGLPWEGNPVAPPAEPCSETIDALLGRVCARISHASIQYVTPVRIEKDEVVCAAGERFTVTTLAAELLATPPAFWPLPELTGVGPVPAIEALLERCSVEFFLFPELRLQDGQVFRRALHAKALAITTREGKRSSTHLLVGAPNLERLSDTPSEIIEAALYRVLPGEWPMAQELIAAPVEQLYLQHRPQSVGSPPAPSPLESAVFDARTQTLMLSFRPGTRALSVAYNELQLIDAEPRLREVFPSFALDRHCAELRVEEGEHTSLVPIAFSHVGALHCGEPTGELSFWELVDLRCGRDGTQGNAELPDDLHAPQRVFAALASLVEDVARSGQGLGALRVALEGPLGLERFIASFLGATSLDRSEAWLYGQELVRALKALRLPTGHKQQAIGRLIGKLDKALIPPVAPYAKVLERLYQGSK